MCLRQSHKELTGNRIINIETLATIFSILCCPVCFSTGIKLSENSKEGLCSNLALVCDCGFTTGFTSRKILIMKRIQPHWNSPSSTLKLYNSLTKEKEIFIPQNGNIIHWYCCGPTVYNSSHLGHARSYITFDILRRILSNYFGYDVFFILNITDVDDKIIKRARQNYLYEQFKETNSNIKSVINDVKNAIKHYETLTTEASEENNIENIRKAIKNAENSNSAFSSNVEDLDRLFEESKDVLSEWLDYEKGSNVNENSIFSALPKKFENEFLEDMRSLNVKDPNELTRVSEYIEEIVNFIKKIISNGFAYESNGSVYFDTIKFADSPDHVYGKLVPQAIVNLKEGSSDRLKEKRNLSDFVMWKSSKPGEPAWNSPWGKGRPGWHIECSVMASEMLGETLDIHSGGWDLKFPHHDNELAQSEAYFNKNDWVRYFLHSGHLTISGCKMSKSLKNFITIKKALEDYTPRQIRLAFLMHSWKDTMDYNPETLNISLQFERLIREFKLNVQDLRRKNLTTGSKRPLLRKYFFEKKSEIHEALCDNMDTRSVLYKLQELVRQSNKNMKNEFCYLFEDILSYILKILQIFGVEFEEFKGSNFEDKMIPYLTVLADFRTTVKELALELKATKILSACDDLRDYMCKLGIRLEDCKGQKAIIKYSC